ncbi:glycosyltransferase family 2 protein [uncultured Chryseobacterium sp.]|uniref:glycosyltransferase family 2 protein n=1 Tax=uncultured Chryseobacterium sp. TaxID=259322 RepID=UPI0025CCBD21|nr:glycosyltransferase family 2 protein [uncultured Chryseobacterium sp.]
MKKIAILLSTYNGEKFLEQQIESVLVQSFQNWDLFIRDDGSTDSTLSIIERFCTKYNNIHLFECSENIGACESFLWLLKNTDAEYYMFCDQDDIWQPDKISLSLNLMKETELKYTVGLPILIHTDLKVVDTNLKEISRSFWSYAKLKQRYLSDFNYLGVCNGVTGCTTLINQNVKDIVFPINTKPPMHDYFIALKVAKYGKIVFLNTPTILYRQHQKNEVGATNINVGYFFLRLKKIKETIRDQMEMHAFLKEFNYGSMFKFYYFKLRYTIIRNI